MKYAAIVLSIIFLCSCADTENESLKLNNEQLVSNIQKKNQQINNLVSSLQDISDRIDGIKDKEQLIVTSNAENPISLQRKIIHDVQLLDELLETSKWEITNLENKLDSENEISDELRSVIASLKMDLVERDKETRLLKEDILNMELCNAELNDILNVHVVENELMKRELNRVYFTFGTLEELKVKGVVEKRGGVFGLLGGKSLKDNFNKTYFTEADLRKVKEIPVQARKLEIITPHHEDSYAIELNDENIITKIVIIDQDKFWEASKYLTMVVKQ